MKRFQIIYVIPSVQPLRVMDVRIILCYGALMTIDKQINDKMYVIINILNRNDGLKSQLQCRLLQKCNLKHPTRNTRLFKGTLRNPIAFYFLTLFCSIHPKTQNKNSQYLSPQLVKQETRL